MCGIFSLLNNDNTFTKNFIESQFKKGVGRGPEFSSLSEVGIKIMFGFHRLAINGLNQESNQPIIHKDIILICNGEIYNYKELYKMMNIAPKTDSDCEVIIHLYLKYGIEYTLQMLDGVFSFILLDNNLYNGDSKLYVARDPFGVRPLYTLQPVNKKKSYGIHSRMKNNKLLGFASEMKVLNYFCQLINKDLNTLFEDEYDRSYIIEQFTPGTFSLYTLGTKVHSQWKLTVENKKYTVPGFTSMFLDKTSMVDVYLNIQKYLISAVEKRCSTTERPVACLLSGGLDSSLVAALVNDYHQKRRLPTIETYSIGLANSEDLKYARIVAEYLGTRHTEIILSEQDFIDAIPEVIQAIESYDTTTVRASIGNYLLGKYITANSDAKVIFNGDGADELMGGYLYMGSATDTLEFDRECKRLLGDIYLFDVLRSDKSISSHGLEPRTPYLDRAWVQYYLSLPMEMRFHRESNQMEKYLVRNAFSWEYFKSWDAKPILPNEILYRRKEAFSDGVTGKERSLFEILGEFAEKKMEQIILEEDLDMGTFMWELQMHNLPETAEQEYYRYLFEKFYGGMGKAVPYFWMPKYVEATDASARTLSIY